ncbi:MAG: DUF2196 domain-containing protein, partial [Candidatus Aminicenantes bacterium]
HPHGIKVRLESGIVGRVKKGGLRLTLVSSVNVPGNTK